MVNLLLNSDTQSSHIACNGHTHSCYKKYSDRACWTLDKPKTVSFASINNCTIILLNASGLVLLGMLAHGGGEVVTLARTAEILSELLN